MIINIPHVIRNFKPRHKAVLSIAGGYSIAGFSTSLMYLFLPIMLTLQFSEQRAGAILSIGTIITFFALAISGELANRIGAIKVLRISIALFFIGALIWLLFPDSTSASFMMLFCFFAAYGFRIFQCYVLKMTHKSEGGTLFGLVESIVAIGSFLATLLFPYFEEIAHPFMPLAIMFSMLILLGINIMVPPDTGNNKQEFHKLFHFKKNISKGLRFIKENHHYPLFFLSTILFEGIFYSTIWFLFPLYLIHESIGVSRVEGLSLGVYEIVTIFFGGVCGYLADTYGWKRINIIGRTAIIVGSFFLLMYSGIYAIILLGVLIGIGNNMIYGAGAHILEKKDAHHSKDGSFTAFQRMIDNIGYVVLPICIGLLYSRWGYTAAMALMVVLVSVLGCLMIWYTLRK